ncbi:hypothetical protein [Lacinutrix chionoecetis]
MKALLLLIATLFFAQCNQEVNYYHGHILDANTNPMENLKVYERGNTNSYGITDAEGYFKIKKEKNSLSRFLYVESPTLGLLDSIQTVGTQGGEKIIYSFVEGKSDTLYLNIKQ